MSRENSCQFPNVPDPPPFRLIVDMTTSGAWSIAHLGSPLDRDPHRAGRLRPRTTPRPGTHSGVDSKRRESRRLSGWFLSESHLRMSVPGFATRAFVPRAPTGGYNDGERQCGLPGSRQVFRGLSLKASR